MAYETAWVLRSCHFGDNLTNTKKPFYFRLLKKLLIWCFL